MFGSSGASTCCLAVDMYHDDDSYAIRVHLLHPPFACIHDDESALSTQAEIRTIHSEERRI